MRRSKQVLKPRDRSLEQVLHRPWQGESDDAHSVTVAGSA